MTQEQKQRIIDILNYHGQLIGVDRNETDKLVSIMKKIRASTMDNSINAMIHEYMSELCDVLGYVTSQQNNNSRKSEDVAQRDAISYFAIHKFDKYANAPEVVASFFGKDRTMGIAIQKRVLQREETKDPIFMFYHNQIVTGLIDQTIQNEAA